MCPAYAAPDDAERALADAMAQRPLRDDAEAALPLPEPAPPQPQAVADAPAVQPPRSQPTDGPGPTETGAEGTPASAEHQLDLL